MHNLYWNKIIIALLFFVFTFNTVDAQVNPKGNYNFWNYKKKPFYFGLTLGVHNSGYLTSKSKNFVPVDTIYSITSGDRMGLNVNIITNLKIGEYFDFRFIPGFAFSERRLQYETMNVMTNFKRIESVFLELPVLMRFKSDPYKDKRLFIVAGLKYSYDVSSNSRVREDQIKDLIQIAPHDFQFEVGAGMQFFFPFFIFSPEVKFSQGIGNIHILNNNINESRVLDTVKSRAFTFSLHFEG